MKTKKKNSKAHPELAQTPKGLPPSPTSPLRGTPSDSGEMKRVPRTSVVVVKNVRREFEIEELLASVREQGIVQPLIVRPRLKHTLLEPDLVTKAWRVVKTLPDGCNEIVKEWPTSPETDALNEKNAKEFFAALPKGDYELVAGERRYRCAEKLKLAEIPVIVRGLDDKQAREIQLIENMQREGLSAIDEAQGFQDAIDSKDYGETWTASVQALAFKLGKSKSHVFQPVDAFEIGRRPAQRAQCRQG
jgi:hypothetical protein